MRISDWSSDVCSSDLAVTVMLDEKGEQLSSMEFARKLEAWRDQGVRECRFLIGAADGFDEAERERADLLIAFGRSTWPHMMAREIGRASCRERVCQYV